MSHTDDIRALLALVDADYARFQTKLNAAQTQIGTLTSRNTALTAQNTSLTKANATLTTNLAAANALIAELKALTRKGRFRVFDAMRFPGNPDFSRFGLPKFKIAYVAEFWPGSDQAVPNIAYIKETMIPKWKAANPGLTHLMIDIEHWRLQDTTGTVLQQNIQYHLDVLKCFREEWPSLKIGYYGEIPIRSLNHLNTDVAARTTAWQAKNDALMALVNAVDFFCPSVYSLVAHHDDNVTALDVNTPNPVGSQNSWARYCKDMIAECRRLRPSIPCYPVYTPHKRLATDIHAPEGQFGYEAWYEMLRIGFDDLDDNGGAADGIVIWTMAGGSPQFDYNRPWWLATKQFIQDKDIGA